jgi:hypothetical protein
MRNARWIALLAICFVAACKGAKYAAMTSQATRDESVKMSAATSAASGGPAARSLAAAAPAEDKAEMEPAAVPTGPSLPETLTPSMIIRTGNASIEVDSLSLGIGRVRLLAARVGGFVANTSIQQGRDQGKIAQLEIRLPSSRFEEAIAGLQPIGKLETVNVSAEDVGEEYVDVQARAANAHRLEQRLIEVLATKTGKLSDILNVERELARVREDIERMEGRARYLRTRSAISTLSITVHEPMPIVGERGSWSVISAAFKQGWRNCVDFVAGFIALLGTLIPLAIIGGGFALAALTLWRKRRKGEE